MYTDFSLFAIYFFKEKKKSGTAAETSLIRLYPFSLALLKRNPYKTNIYDHRNVVKRAASPNRQCLDQPPLHGNSHLTFVHIHHPILRLVVSYVNSPVCIVLIIMSRSRSSHWLYLICVKSVYISMHQRCRRQRLFFIANHCTANNQLSSDLESNIVDNFTVQRAMLITTG